MQATSNIVNRVVRAIPRKALRASGVILLALILYFMGLKVLLLPVLVILGAVYLPVPKIFRSFLGRLVVGFLLVFALLQVAGTLQFMLLPASGFATMAVLTAVLFIAVLLFAPDTRFAFRKKSVVSGHDWAALLVISFFLLPFTPIIAGNRSVDRIAQIGGIQAIDATNHYAGIAEMTEAEHLNYKPGYYYPKGFHLATGFVQNTVFKQQSDFSWRTNTLVYFTQYLVLGSLLGYVLYYLAAAWMEDRKEKLTQLRGWQKLTLALCIGPTLALLYLVPFVSQGFLNYYYVCTTIVVGLLFLFHTKTARVEFDLGHDEALRWGLFAYLLLVFGASVSWPLLVPVLVLIPVLYIFPRTLKQIVGLGLSFVTTKAWVVLAAFVLQLIPIYFQLAYSDAGAAESINLTGGLRAFHPYILLTGIVLIAVILLSKRVNDGFKEIVSSVFIPMYLLVGALAVLQYFRLGEIHYYVIKSSLLLEMLILVLAVTAFLYLYFENNMFAPKYALLLPIIPFVAAILLISSTPDPLKDTRDLFRSYSGREKPAYFDHDAEKYVELGTGGEIRHFNSTVLHYNAEQDKLFAHMQLPFWANMMQYDSSRQDFLALHCVGALYSNLAFGSYSNTEQEQLVQRLRECAVKVRERGEKFYIVTDKDSSSQIKQRFGDVAEVVY